jgi:hypothetical protein
VGGAVGRRSAEMEVSALLEFKFQYLGSFDGLDCFGLF